MACELSTESSHEGTAEKKVVRAAFGLRSWTLMIVPGIIFPSATWSDLMEVMEGTVALTGQVRFYIATH